ncbi:hypothetical protein BS50DRAFT_19210 [Corynespora cassiicola Philippines]|uniref:Uncharacterized protein n=1 Tax=Corynespora cassiicola Philippines TaxID=1448308 RepID=A0A2T2PA88_CORCC|nr:hypothetical protein BS50DRAFT_19210 [Corynespora cassiicola Philippines]
MLRFYRVDAVCGSQFFFPSFLCKAPLDFPLVRRLSVYWHRVQRGSLARKSTAQPRERMAETIFLVMICIIRALGGFCSVTTLWRFAYSISNARRHQAKQDGRTRLHWLARRTWGGMLGGCISFG